MRQSLLDIEDNKQRADTEQKQLLKMKAMQVTVSSQAVIGDDQWSYSIAQVVFNCGQEVCLF